MIYDFFCDDVPHEQDVNVNKETKKRRECEIEIKEKCKQKVVSRGKGIKGMGVAKSFQYPNYI